ncbi:response regulator [bacterium]|jgi:DNA-binding response OmpR family regulator|nr:response regulator [bacterium]|tara:strand:+ start:10662 stop:11063 length:402 start_codon:yes stop_codon:yes gene_type:complete
MTKKDTKKETKKAPAKKSKKILIVEDERPLAHALELKFSHEGYDVTIATDGAEGLKMANATKYNMILLDLIMPQMDGFTFMEQLKKKSPIIILSNLGQEEDKERAKKLGAIEYFVKSNTPITEIIKKVKSSIK